MDKYFIKENKIHEIRAKPSNVDQEIKQFEKQQHMCCGYFLNGFNGLIKAQQAQSGSPTPQIRSLIDDIGARCTERLDRHTSFQVRQLLMTQP